MLRNFFDTGQAVRSTTIEEASRAVKSASRVEADSGGHVISQGEVAAV